jgi:hypothetical protein
MMKNRENILTRKCKGNGPSLTLRRRRKGGTETVLIQRGCRALNGFVYGRIRLYLQPERLPNSKRELHGVIYG